MDKKFEDEFKVLCDAYEKSLPNKIQEIDGIFKNLKTQWEEKSLMELTSLVHKLSGSAGSYGYNLISEKSKQLEQHITRMFPNVPANKQTMTDLENMILEIRNIISANKSEKLPKSFQKTQSNLVYIFDDDSDKNYRSGESWSKQISDRAIINGYEIKICSETESFFNALKDKIPAALIINFDSLSNPSMINLNDAHVRDIIDLYFKNIYTIFVSKTGEFKKRLEAVRMGCQSYLTAPFNIDELIDELNNIKYLWDGLFKALIIDDDPEILTLYSSLLTNAKLENKTLTSPKNIEQVLHTFQPDIILLDLNMPECNGMEIASIIRQQKLYEDIPIIFFSTEENKNKQLQAMSVGADDFISKSTDPNYLIQIIRNKACRYKKFKSMLIKDNLTGAFNFMYMGKQLEKYIKFFKSNSISFTICITEIGNISTVQQHYGYAASNNLLTGLYVLLNNQLDSSKIIGHYTPEKFLIIFPECSIETVRLQMKKIQDKFHSTLQYANGKAYSSSFKIGVAGYLGVNSIDELIMMAEQDLTSCIA